MGGDINAFTAKEYTCYYARVLDRDLEMAVDHLADMLEHSLIRKADLDAERQVILEEINMHEDSPEDVVHDLFTETLWPNHPLGRPILGTVETIRAATPASVKRFYRSNYVPGHLVVAAAGQPAPRGPAEDAQGRAWTRGGSFARVSRPAGACARPRRRPRLPVRTW